MCGLLFERQTLVLGKDEIIAAVFLCESTSLRFLSKALF